MVGLPERLFSGGQSGADLGALYAGLSLGYRPGETLGGWAPRGYLTEFGKKPWLKTRFGMREHATSNYLARTRRNVLEADQLLVFGRVDSPGSGATLRLARELGVPYWVNPRAETLRKLAWGDVMVAGNRESGNRGLEAWVDWFLRFSWGPMAMATGQKAAILIPPQPCDPKLPWSPLDQWTPLPTHARMRPRTTPGTRPSPDSPDTLFGG